MIREKQSNDGFTLYARADAVNARHVAAAHVTTHVVAHARRRDVMVNVTPTARDRRDHGRGRRQWSSKTVESWS